MQVLTSDFEEERLKLEYRLAKLEQLEGAMAVQN